MGAISGSLMWVQGPCTSTGKPPYVFSSFPSPTPSQVPVLPQKLVSQLSSGSRQILTHRVSPCDLRWVPSLLCLESSMTSQLSCSLGLSFPAEAVCREGSNRGKRATGAEPSPLPSVSPAQGWQPFELCVFQAQQTTQLEGCLHAKGAL